MSDAEIFATVPVAVAINADHHLSGPATHADTGGDLREVHEPARHRRWFEDRAVTQPNENWGRNPGFPLSLRRVGHSCHAATTANAVDATASGTPSDSR
ncbi:hypothetical protein [Streptomyces lavendofoliae]